MKEQQIQIKYVTAALSELSVSDRNLYESALKASERAYASYSHFQVGAAVLLGNGMIVTGANQENAAYPSGLCAERIALFAAGANYPNEPVVALAVIAQSEGEVRDESEGEVRDEISPCGACCQVLLESESRSKCPMRILLCGKTSVRIIESVSSLLPFSFTPTDLLK